MKRKKPLVRSTPIPRGKPPKRKTRIPKVNVERQKKARARYAKKLQAYKRSETCVIVDRRSGGRCEAWDVWRWERSSLGHWTLPHRLRVDITPPGHLPDMQTTTRCLSDHGLAHHHTTYARFGGNERPEDIRVVCQVHHDYFEALKPAGNRRTRLLRGLAN